MKKTARFAAVALMAALALSACGDRENDGDDASDGGSSPSESTSSATQSSEQYPDTKACMVSDSGGFDDQSFNQTSLKGQTDAAEQFGVQTAQIESNADTEYPDNIDQLVAGQVHDHHHGRLPPR